MSFISFHVKIRVKKENVFYVQDFLETKTWCREKFGGWWGVMKRAGRYYYLDEEMYLHDSPPCHDESLPSLFGEPMCTLDVPTRTWEIIGSARCDTEYIFGDFLYHVCHIISEELHVCKIMYGNDDEKNIFDLTFNDVLDRETPSFF